MGKHKGLIDISTGVELDDASANRTFGGVHTVKDGATFNSEKGDNDFIVKKYEDLADWTPTAIDTALWLDADDASTITEVAGVVSQWDDKSGNGNNALQATAVHQPTYSSTGWDGSLPSIDFAWTSDGKSLVTAALTGATESERVYFMVKDDNIVPNQTRRTQFLHSVEGIALYNKAAAPVQGMGTLDDTSTFVGEAAAFPIRKQILTYVYGSGGKFYRDGNVVFDGPWTPKTDLVDTSPLSIGRSDGSRMSGEVAEVIVMNRSVCTDAVREKIEGYLAWKWGTVAFLPSSHPYKSAAPILAAGGIAYQYDAGDDVHKFDGGLSNSITTVTNDYIVLPKDFSIVADGTSNTVTITLPAAPVTGQVYNIACLNSTFTVDVDFNSKNFYDSSSNESLFKGENLKVQYDGTQYISA